MGGGGKGGRENRKQGTNDQSAGGNFQFRSRGRRIPTVWRGKKSDCHVDELW